MSNTSSKVETKIKPLGLLFLTIPFVALYFLVRSLPVEPCEFLHARTYNSAGALDYCGPGDSAFVDLTRRSWPFDLKLEALDELRVGETCRFRVEIRQFDGSPLGPNEVALSHTKKIHLLAIDPSLDDYQHLHPQPDVTFPGVWNFALTPAKAGQYRVFLDFIPLRSPRRVLLSTGFEVAGESVVSSPKHSNIALREGYSFSAKSTTGSLMAGQESVLRLEVLAPTGQSAVLQPVMGAFAHLVAFDVQRRGFAHLHPKENLNPVEGRQTHSAPLSFGFRPPVPGHYRLWAQVRIGDKEIFAPFDLKVDAPS